MVVTASDNDITSQLERVAGVRVSSEWLRACLAFLRETRQPETADAVLYQVLHSDLRDVVSRGEDGGILRQALSQNHATLPESFCLMVQVEELLDVSLNAEARLQVGPASATAPTPVGNQRLRCLKLYLSDGYKQTAQHLVAMEVSPLRDLSVNSKAGIKMVLRGPLTCRFGIIMCNPGNASVLGGSVASLMEIQRKALEQAKKVAGVGVDPTVKALIWNPVGAEDEGEQDEGEGESRDVEAAPPRPARTATAPPPPVRRNVPSPMPPPVRPTPPVQRAAPPASFPPRQQQAPPRSAGSNPYATSRSQSSAMSSTTTTSRPTPVSTSSTASNAVVDLSEDEAMAEPQVLDLVTPTNNTVTSTVHAPTEVAVSPPAPPSQDTSFSQETRGSFSTLDTEPVSLSELKGIIARLQTDQNVYRQYENKVFVVPCKMIGHHQCFNIDKKKKKKRDRKNKDDKYEYSYIMSVHMGGTDTAAGTVLCSVANDILTTNFGMTASEMRELQKTDPQKCEKVVQEKGLEIKASLVRLASTQLKLIQSAANFFDGTAKDESKPILQLIHRDLSRL